MCNAWLSIGHSSSDSTPHKTHTCHYKCPLTSLFGSVYHSPIICPRRKSDHLHPFPKANILAFLLKEQLRWKWRKKRTEVQVSTLCNLCNWNEETSFTSALPGVSCEGGNCSLKTVVGFFLHGGEGGKSKKENTSKCREKSWPQPEKQTTHGPHMQEDQKLSLHCKATEKRS